MDIEDQVASEIYNEIIIDLITEYKSQLEQDNESTRDKFIQEFYKSLDKEKKEQFILFLDAFAMDIVSIILGGFDGSTKLGKFFGGFSVNYEEQEITPYLQDSFYQDDYEKKTRQNINDS